MKLMPISFFDKALLNGRNLAETIIGHIKEFSSLSWTLAVLGYVKRHRT
jgi:hypothetical protein